jgi:hypothetical protein
MATYQTSYFESVQYTYDLAVVAMRDFINRLGTGATLRYTDVIYLQRDRSKSAAVVIFDGIYVNEARSLHFVDGDLVLTEV